MAGVAVPIILETITTLIPALLKSAQDLIAHAAELQKLATSYKEAAAHDADQGATLATQPGAPTITPGTGVTVGTASPSTFPSALPRPTPPANTAGGVQGGGTVPS